MSHATQERIIKPSDYLDINGYDFIKPKMTARGKRTLRAAEYVSIHESKDQRTRDRKRARKLIRQFREQHYSGVA